MKFTEKLSKFIEDKQKKIQKGINVSEQLKAERQRKKKEEAKILGPGTFRYGLVYKQNPLDFMKDVYDRRKEKRNQKEEND